MKKSYPYIIGGVVLLLLVLVLAGRRGKLVHRLDERITLRQRDKIPYGTLVAKQLLPSLFPNAAVQTDALYPGAWEKINAYGPDQAVILMSDYFGAGKEELDRLSEFAERGNSVFVIARSFSDEAANFFNLGFSNYGDSFFTYDQDSLRIKLERPAFADNSLFVYPGKRYEGSIRRMDTTRTEVLGRNDGGWPNFVHLRKGAGNFYIHTAPLAFSNYFILHKHNATYFQDVLSVLPANTTAILWNEYFLENEKGKKEVAWLGALFKYPPFKWGFVTALATLILSLFLGMRRRQRMIPLYEKPKNDSLDFVKTLGRLYYDGQDHKNLAEKMGTYFLEHVRSTYKVATHTLDDDFVKTLQAKSGYPEEGISKIVAEIKQLPDWPNISEERLAAFHKQLEHFYQNT